MPEGKQIKNSWMEDNHLVAAAVKAVKENRPLRWSDVTKNQAVWDRWEGFNDAARTTNEDFKRAAGWVSRERKSREWGFDVSKLKPFSERTLKTVSKAAIALRNADLGIESPQPEIAKPVVYSPPLPESAEDRALNWLKGFGFQFIGFLLMIPLIILFGTDFHHGGLVGILLTILFIGGIAVGIPILIFRFIQAKADSVRSGKPLKKNWYE